MTTTPQRHGLRLDGFDDSSADVASNVVGGAGALRRTRRHRFGASGRSPSGDDFPPPSWHLGHRGIDTSGVGSREREDFRWAGRYSSDLGSRTTLDTQLNVFADFRPAVPAPFRDSELILLANIHPALQLEVLDQVARPRLVAADTMNFWIDQERDTLLRVLGRVDTLVINDEELRQLAGDHSIRRAARAVLAMGPRRLVCKRGEHGGHASMRMDVSSRPKPASTRRWTRPRGHTICPALWGAGAHGELESAGLRRALLTAAAVASAHREGLGTRGTPMPPREIAARRPELERALRFAP
jgi:sugar/nucleoside kinase (ribokinase family)